jgi:diacylglycerol kinase (ATP)
VLIYNPRAGRFGRNGNLQIARALKILEQQGHHVTVAPTTGPRTAGAIARYHVDRGAELILAAGGDGTINEVAEGMVHSEVPLGILPGGTANVLAMEMKLGNRLERVAERLDDLCPRRVAVGHVLCDDGQVSRHFLLMAGAGLDAHIVYNVDGVLKARIGKLAYWAAAWGMLGRSLPQIQVRAGGRDFACSFALASRVRNYGGDFEIARSVTLCEDTFEVVMFEGLNSLPYVKYFLGMATNRLLGMKGVTVLRTTSLKVACADDPEVYVQIDGELAGRLPAEIRIVPDALTLLAPAEYGGVEGQVAAAWRDRA